MTDLESAVAAELTAEFKPAATVRSIPRPVPTPTHEDPHATWIQLGEKLHDKARSKVEDLQHRCEVVQAEIVGKMRELDQINAELDLEAARLASFRRRLGYGR